MPRFIVTDTLSRRGTGEPRNDRRHRSAIFSCLTKRRRPLLDGRERSTAASNFTAFLYFRYPPAINLLDRSRCTRLLLDFLFGKQRTARLLARRREREREGERVKERDGRRTQETATDTMVVAANRRCIVNLRPARGNCGPGGEQLFRKCGRVSRPSRPRSKVKACNRNRYRRDGPRHNRVAAWLRGSLSLSLPRDTAVAEITTRETRRLTYRAVFLFCVFVTHLAGRVEPATAPDARRRDA